MKRVSIEALPRFLNTAINIDGQRFLGKIDPAGSKTNPCPISVPILRDMDLIRN
jgi:hypothetical protein